MTIKNHLLSGPLLMAATLPILCGCNETVGGTDLGSPSAFHGPQAIAASEDYILVSNTAVSYAGGQVSFGQGFVVFIDRRTRRIVGRVDTTQPNPQAIVVCGKQAFVVNSGIPSVDKEGYATNRTSGGIDILDLSVGTPSLVSHNIPLGLNAKDPRIGGYGFAITSPDCATAFIGSGSRGDVFKVDLARQKVLRGPENPIVLFPTAKGKNGLTIVRPWGKGGLAVLNFNTDELCLSSDFSGDLKQRTCGAVGKAKDMLEGPIDVVQGPAGQALVLMSIANGIYGVDVDSSPFTVNAKFAPAGQDANRMRVHNQHGIIANSSSHNLQRTHLSTGATMRPFSVLPLKSTPYDLTITTEAQGDVAWVTLNGTNQVAVVSLDSGAVQSLLPLPEAKDNGVADSARDGGPTEGGPGDAKGCPEGGAPIIAINSVVLKSYGAGAGFGQSQMPGVVLGAPKGYGETSGSTDVVSLGTKGELVVDFGPYDMVDGPGPDFIVFENPMLIGGQPYTPLAEPAHIGVSQAGTMAKDFVEFPCDLTKTKGDASSKTWPFPGCAGVRPVFAGPDQCISPADPKTAGGDAFDLSQIGVKQARYLRIRDAGVSTLGTNSKGFDLDAVVLINFKKR